MWQLLPGLIADAANAPAGINPFAKDVLQLAGGLAAVAGGLVAAFKAIKEMRDGSRVRVRELNWKLAKEADSTLEEVNNRPMLKNAALLLDWQNRNFVLPSGLTKAINHEQTCNALRTTNAEFDEVELFVRDCFDEWCTYLGRVENRIKVWLVWEADVLGPLSYYVKFMAKDKSIFQEFMKAYGYEQALRFAERVPEWAVAHS